MSIAVSAIVRPSRMLTALAGAMAAVAAGVAFAIASGLVGDLTTPIRWSLSALVFFLATFGFYHGIRSRKTIQLDISGTGQIRLLKAGGEPPCTRQNRPHVREIGELVRLMDNSTIWARMLLLRLRLEDGRMVVVPVFPDSVDREAFRALSVACRWIAAQPEAKDVQIF
ncbi:protein YgfX [Noviherbaspirillum sp.]|uniref:protein YgfX n=1 Tax=Noviherbaspirillum sp. TaxID=1926288 RepID=UPI002D23F4FC|nr:protein YgfX [Noviherbaspirillum sp.]HZW22675.1 protein YgfX [Noviherbaspirillum sp.]